MVDISNVVNITVQAAESSLGNYNINAFLYLASEAPVSTWTESYRIYKNAKDVATDFGSNSNVAKDATVFFAQNPNVMSGNGYLIVAPLQEDPDTQTTDLRFLAVLTVPPAESPSTMYTSHSSGFLEEQEANLLLVSTSCNCFNTALRALSLAFLAL